MPRGRHSLEPSTIRRRRYALVAAPVVTALAVGVGVATSGFSTPVAPMAAGDVSATIVDPGGLAPTTPAPERTLGTSRSADRVPLVDNRVPEVTGRMWSTATLKLRTEPRADAKDVGLVKDDTRVAVTGRRQAGYAEVVVDRLARWVTADYLSRTKQVPPPAASAPAAPAAPAASASGSRTAPAPATGLSNAPCPDGSSIEGALQPASVKVYRAVCAAFPELTTYGGQDGHGEHVNGEAIDFMVPDSATGQRVADFVYAHHAELDLFDIIWSQHIWTIERASEGFRSMSDRGSATANHYDHVHIKIN